MNEPSFEEDEGFDQSSEFVPPEILMRERSLDSEKKSLERKTTGGEQRLEEQLLENSQSLTQDSKGQPIKRNLATKIVMKKFEYHA